MSAQDYEQLTLFQGDSLASRSVLPGSEEARKMTVTSGRRCLELYKKSGCPVSREQIEKGEWQRIPLNMNPEYFTHKYNLRKKCSLCGYVMPDEYPDFNFCPNCGAPMTDEAVEMVMERMEALRNEG